jgi:hypothetical protein
MKPMTDADESRRLGKIQSDKAGKLPEGSDKQAHLQRDRDYEADARSKAWRDSSLKAPK